MTTIAEITMTHSQREMRLLNTTMLLSDLTAPIYPTNDVSIDLYDHSQLYNDIRHAFRHFTPYLKRSKQTLRLRGGMKAMPSTSSEPKPILRDKKVDYKTIHKTPVSDRSVFAIPIAPEFYPTLEEFSDPFAYIAKIRHIGEQAGIVG
jgi:jmjN domain